MSVVDPHTGFWDFSLSTYRRDGVAEACLWLQNDRGVDVNLLLFCIWYGATRGVFQDGILDEARVFSGKWRDEVVQPLRNARSWMKRTQCNIEQLSSSQIHELREDIKACELNAEKAQQTALERIASDAEPVELTPDAAWETSLSNILGYFRVAQISLDAESEARIALIQARAFCNNIDGGQAS